MTKKVFWLSFCDGDKPKGQQFLGACLVEVTDVEATASLAVITEVFPRAKPGAEWVAAASRKAHRLKCNPGGEMLSFEIPLDHPNIAHFPFGVLMDRPTIARLDRETGGLR
jgi:hypothetical protein